MLLIHHAGKDGARGLRGSTALYGAVDAVLEAKKTEDEEGNEIPIIKVLTLRDQKDGEAGEAVSLALRQRILDYDHMGRPVTSCVIEEVTDAGQGAQATGASPYGETSAVPSHSGADLDAAVAALAKAIAEHGVETDQGRAAHADAWVACYAAANAHMERDRAANRLRALAVELIAQGRIAKVTHGGDDKHFIIAIPF